MTEKEAQLRKERDKLYNQYLLKDKELHEYRNKQESGALEELNKQYKGKIIQVRLWDRGLSPLNKRERDGDYEIVFVEEVVHEYDTEIEIKGTVFDLFRDTTYRDVADHIADSDLDKITAKVYHTDQMRISKEDIFYLSDDGVSGAIGEFDYAFEQMQHKFWKAVRGSENEFDESEKPN